MVPVPRGDSFLGTGLGKLLPSFALLTARGAKMIPEAKAGLMLCTLWGVGWVGACLQAGITAALLCVET